jgi:hypothetical protein
MYLNTIIHADCLHFLPKLPAESVNFILTDPPYLVGYESRDGRRVPNDDNDRWIAPAFAQMYRVLERDAFCVSFYGWPHADNSSKPTVLLDSGWRDISHFPSDIHLPLGTPAISMNAHTCWSRVFRPYPKKPSATLSTGPIAATSCIQRKSRSRCCFLLWRRSRAPVVPCSTLSPAAAHRCLPRRCWAGPTSASKWTRRITESPATGLHSNTRMATWLCRPYNLRFPPLRCLYETC